MKKIFLSILFFVIIGFSGFCEIVEINSKYDKNDKYEVRLTLSKDTDTDRYIVSLFSAQNAFYVVQLSTFFKTKQKAYQAYSDSLNTFIIISPTELAAFCETLEGVNKDYYTEREDIFAVTYTLFE